MLGKLNKKDPIRLKFDTSSQNLACFINKRSKLAVDNDTYERQSRNSRKKTKNNKQKAHIYPNQRFLESILANAFTQEFAGSEDIKKLVNNLEVSSEDDQFFQIDHNPTVKCFDENCNKDDLEEDQENYKAIISEWVENPKDEAAVSSTRVGTEDTPQRSNQPDRNFSQSSFSENLVFPFEVIQCLQLTHLYDQNYYLCQQFPQKQGSERKKRNVTNEEAKEYRIDLDKVQMDGRTTLMIRNIPNKYTQQLLLQEFNKNFKVKFDFFYLPIDYNNSCNVGYAFINFIHAKFIPSFYNQFNAKKWNRFNSQKICSLTYARIQGTGALRSHFKNSHVMQQKDKRFRPLLNQLDEEQRYSLSKIVQGQLEKM